MTEDNMEKAGEAMRRDLENVHFTPAMQFKVLESIRPQKRMRSFKRPLVLICTLVLLAALGAALAGGADVFGNMWIDPDAELSYLQSIREGEKVQLHEDEVWHVPARGHWPDMTVVFEQSYFDGGYVSVGFRVLDEMQTYHHVHMERGAATDVEAFDAEQLHAWQDVDTGILYDWYVPEMQNEPLPWTCTLYLSRVDMNVGDGQLGCESRMNSLEDEKETYLMLSIPLHDMVTDEGTVDMSAYWDAQQLEVTFDMRHSIVELTAAEEGLYVRQCYSQPMNAPYVLSIARTEESDYQPLQLGELNFEVWEQVDYRAIAQSEMNEEHIRTAIRLWKDYEETPAFRTDWVENWGEMDTAQDLIYQYRLLVNGKEAELLACENVSRALNQMHAELTFARPEGDISDILLIPVYTLSGPHADEYIRLK